MPRNDRNNGDLSAPNPDNAENQAVNPNAEGEAKDNAAEADKRDQGEGAPESGVQAMASGTDALSVPGATRSLGYAQPAYPVSDTAAANAGNASPVYDPRYNPTIRTQYANQHTMGQKPDAPPSPWPVAPAPVDPQLVSPTGLVSRPAMHEAAISHLTMRLGEMRNFLSGFDHDSVLKADHPEMHALVTHMKHALGIPELVPMMQQQSLAVPHYGAGYGGVAQSGVPTNDGRQIPTHAGSYAQGSFGPHGVQANEH